MNDLVQYGAACVVEIAWIPVAARFWTAWRTRKNPISLSIVALVVFMMLLGLTPFWTIPNGSDGAFVRFMVVVNEIVSLAVCATFHVAFHIAKRFPDTREDERTLSPTPVDFPGGLLIERARRVLGKHGCGTCEDCVALRGTLGGMI